MSTLDTDFLIPEFQQFPKIPRFSREIIITEKIDGTNAQIFITEDLKMFAGSRNRWLTLEDDNYGFAAWVNSNYVELLKLGPGRHFGEWWGKGIQRNYSQTEKKFSLFNVKRWSGTNTHPSCCSVVPILFQGPLEEHLVLKGMQDALYRLKNEGSLDRKSVV